MKSLWSNDIKVVLWHCFGPMTSLSSTGWVGLPQGWVLVLRAGSSACCHLYLWLYSNIGVLSYFPVLSYPFFLYFSPFLCAAKTRLCKLKKKILLALPRWIENLDFRVLFWFLSTSFLFSNIFFPSFSLHHFSSLVKNIVHWAHNLLMVWIVRVHDVWLCWSDGIMHFQFVGLCMHAPVLLCVGSSCPPASVSSVSFVVGDNKM